MRNTKDKILQTALVLFNDSGINNVSLRQIAQELGISQGNLNYHFKLKEDIIEALYFQLVAQMDTQMKNLETGSTALETLYRISLSSMKKMFEYRFILIDFIHLMNENKNIRSHYGDLMLIRKQQFNTIFKSLIDSKILRPEDLKHEYARLYQRMNIVGDNWINFYSTFDKENTIQYYCDLLFEMIYPYLTNKGKTEYHRILK